MSKENSDIKFLFVEKEKSEQYKLYKFKPLVAPKQTKVGSYLAVGVGVISIPTIKNQIFVDSSPTSRNIKNKFVTSETKRSQQFEKVQELPKLFRVNASQQTFAQKMLMRNGIVPYFSDINEPEIRSSMLVLPQQLIERTQALNNYQSALTRTQWQPNLSQNIDSKSKRYNSKTLYSKLKSLIIMQNVAFQNRKKF